MDILCLNGLPEKFLAQRRELMLAVLRKMVSKDQEGILDLPPWPGVYRPLPRKLLLIPLRHRGDPKPPVARHDRIKPTGDLPVGTKIPTYFGIGTILGYIGKGEDPMRLIPPGTPVWQLSGSRLHSASYVDRYVVQTTRNKQPWYLFPKCVTLEVEFRKQQEDQHG